MARSRVLVICALMVAVAACGSGDSSTAGVSPSPTTVGAIDPDTSGPATVDATAPGSSILNDEEPSVQCLSLRFGSVSDRSVDIAAAARRAAHETARRESAEFRFYLASRAACITHWIAPGRVIILLSVFAKSRPNERREVERARRAMVKCMNEHGIAGDES